MGAMGACWAGGGGRRTAKQNLRVPAENVAGCWERWLQTTGRHKNEPGFRVEELRGRRLRLSLLFETGTGRFFPHPALTVYLSSRGPAVHLPPVHRGTKAPVCR